MSNSTSAITAREEGLLLPELAGTADMLSGIGPQWLRSKREAALARFNELGLPTTRDEEWRFTSLKAVAKQRFRRASEQPADVTAKQFQPFRFPGLEPILLVFVNGRYSPEVSDLPSLPDGITVATLTETVQAQRDLLEPHLTRYAPFEDSAFLALNTALMDDGAVVHVPRGVRCERPIHVLGITVTNGDALLTNPRLLVVAEDSSEVTVIEQYACLDDEDVYLTNAVTEILVGANAHVHHYMIERESAHAFNITSLQVRQERDSRFESHSVLFGGAIVRNDVNPTLAGENCHSLLNGLYLPRGEQHHDNHMRVVHAKPRGDSRQYYTGVLADKARGVFTGRIIVVQDAQKTDAVQSNQNLLLSRDAQMMTKPQLEIYADDVKCTHGATIGQLDAEAIFYLRSRGLSEHAARGLLTYAFAEEALERMSLAPVREFLAQLLVERLPQRESLEQLL